MYCSYMLLDKLFSKIHRDLFSECDFREFYL